MIDVNKPVRTSDGKAAEFVRQTSPTQATFRIEGDLHESHAGRVNGFTWTFDLTTGMWFGASETSGHVRIENVPELDLSKPLDLTKPVFTHDGEAVTILTTASTPELNEEYDLAWPDDVILAKHGDGTVRGHDASGSFLGDGLMSDYDLTNTPPAPKPAVSYRTARHSGGSFPGLTFGKTAFENAEDALRVGKQTGTCWDAVVEVSLLEGRLVDIKLVKTID